MRFEKNIDNSVVFYWLRDVCFCFFLTKRGFGDDFALKTIATDLRKKNINIKWYIVVVFDTFWKTKHVLVYLDASIHIDFYTTSIYDIFCMLATVCSNASKVYM